MVKKAFKNLFFLGGAFFFLVISFLLIWSVSLKLPDFKSFDERKVSLSTKIYDRTGEILLYDVHNQIKRTSVPWEEMGINIKNATVAVEDSEFYQHKGVRLKSTLRAILNNLLKGNLESQGGSTITQQVIKNSLLTSKKTITRKLKEWFLAFKLEQVLGKEEILAVYLNETPYGGNIYGIYEASKTFFDKEPKDLTLAESAYLAAIPKAPTFYSPYGNNKEKLDERKNFVLKRMRDLSFILETEHVAAKDEVVVFKPRETFGIKAPHFVLFVKEYLEQKYGSDVDQMGLKVYTSVDYNLQKQAEGIVLKQAKENEKNWNASNAGMVAIDPKTGQILVMVGSRDYFDKEIDGNFNIATAKRQPGSAFKPFVYVTAFEKGFTSDSVLFDLPTEFQTTCNPYGKAKPGYNQKDCYKPENYDDNYKGPVNLRSALGESRNVPSVKLLYLAGVANSIKTARDMGIKTLSDPNQYGLTLVLGGGEVKLLELTNAYGVFANSGVFRPYQTILKITDNQGNILQEFKDEQYEVLSKNSVLMLNDVLADNDARTPLFGARSFMYFEGRQVAGKTGTTENNRDAWLVGYTPNIVLGVWNGNNDNTSMKKGSSIAGPMWHEMMQILLNNLPEESFEPPVIQKDETLPPVIRGLWQGGKSFFIDTVSQKLATELTPEETKKEKVVTNVHSILYWINKNNLKEEPNPSRDPQFENWETVVQNWWLNNSSYYSYVSEESIPVEYDDVHVEEKVPSGIITGLKDFYLNNEFLSFNIETQSVFPIQKIDVFVNNKLITFSKNPPFNFNINLGDLENLKTDNNLKLIITDSVWNKKELTIDFKVN